MISSEETGFDVDDVNRKAIDEIGMLLIDKLAEHGLGTVMVSIMGFLISVFDLGEDPVKSRKTFCKHLNELACSHEKKVRLRK